MRFLKRWGNTIAYVVLALAVAYAIWAVTALANRVDRDAFDRSMDIRDTQVSACDRTNRLRKDLVLQIPGLKPVGELAPVNCESVYPALRK